MSTSFTSVDALQLHKLEKEYAEKANEAARLESQIKVLRDSREAAEHQVTVEIPVQCLVTVAFEGDDVAEMSVRLAPPSTPPDHIFPKRHFHSGNELRAEQVLEILKTNGWTDSPVEYGFKRPVVDSITPARASRGQTLSVTVAGSDFESGAVVEGPDGVEFDDVEVVDPNTITARLKVTPIATQGADFPITVTNSAVSGYGRGSGSSLTIT